MSEVYDATYHVMQSKIHWDFSRIVDAIASKVDISHEKHIVAQAFLRVAENMYRPCVLMRPMLTYDGDAKRWTAAYGHVQGVGATPADAMDDFDKVWIT